MIPNKFRIPGLTFAENDTRRVKIPSGMLLESLVLSIGFTDTISSAATAARTYGVPIKKISLIVDGGKVLHSWRPSDLVREAQIYEQSALADLIAPPTALTAAAHTGTADIPLLFKEPFSNAGAATNLPTWLYDEVILEVEWGGHAECYQGGAGTVTIGSTQSVDVTAIGVTQDFSSLGDPYTWARKLGRTLRGYKEVDAPESADSEFIVELPRTADFRSILIVTEDANGHAANTIVNAVTLQVDNNLNQFNRVPARMLRADNAKVFGVSMPTGTHVLEFAEDMDISNILEATRMTALNLILDVTSTAGTIRVAYKRIESGPQR